MDEETAKKIAKSMAGDFDNIDEVPCPFGNEKKDYPTGFPSVSRVFFEEENTENL